MTSPKSAMSRHDKQTASRKVSLDLDPYAAPSDYYGKSHASRKVAKSRTLPAVSCQGGISHRLGTDMSYQQNDPSLELLGVPKRSARRQSEGKVMRPSLEMARKIDVSCRPAG